MARSLKAEVDCSPAAENCRERMEDSGSMEYCECGVRGEPRIRETAALARIGHSEN